MTDDVYWVVCPRCHGEVHPTWKYGNQPGQPCYVCDGKRRVKRLIGG